jgi:hypothetical protein
MNPTRRHLVLATVTLPLAVRAHHGWSSFDQNRPIYLEGKADKVAWRNPHAEFVLLLKPGLALPADLAQRKLPAQAAPVDGAQLLSKARLPRRADKAWQIELAPLTRMQAWGVPELKAGTEVALLGFTFNEEKGDAVLRAEYLWVGGKAYGLRSSPA